MSRLASYILASYRRPTLLRECLAQLATSVVPDGWQLEIIVCCPREERLLAGATYDADVGWTSSRATDIGSQLTGAFRHARGELILVTGDDDFQHPLRLKETIRIYETGALMTGIRRFLFWRRTDGALAQWTGDSRRAGGLRSYAWAVLDRCNGWPAGNRNVDHSLDVELSAAGVPLDVDPLPDWIGDGTVGTHGGGNASPSRPFPPPGTAIRRGAYTIEGMPDETLRLLPEGMRERLARCRED